MRLQEYLGEIKKEDLLQCARDLQLRNYSRLRKEALIDKILEQFCKEEFLRKRLSCLTKEELYLLQRALEKPQKLSFTEYRDGMRLSLQWLGSFDKETEIFRVYEEIAEAFRRMDDETFREEQSRKGWLVKCLRFLGEYYGIAPVEVVFTLYRRKVKSTPEEMIDLLLDIPVEVTMCDAFRMEELGMEDWPAKDPVYSERGLIVYIPHIQEDSLDELLARQGEKKFFIPSAQQFDEICRFGYEAGSPAYKKLENFFVRKKNTTYKEAVGWCVLSWTLSQNGNPVSDFMRLLDEHGYVADSDEEVNELLQILKDAHNNTRLKENRGHTANELRWKSTGARGEDEEREGAALRNARTVLEGMSPRPVPKGTVVRAEGKIYPNDPCPCGSGKKYKKCCYLKKG